MSVSKQTYVKPPAGRCPVCGMADTNPDHIVEVCRRAVEDARLGTDPRFTIARAQAALTDA